MVRHEPDWNLRRSIIIACAALAAGGCGGSGPVPITPRFLVDGEPLKRAAITFVRQDEGGGRAAFGSTGDDGVARLTTYEPNDGVMPGDYGVVIVKAPENPRTFVESAAESRDDEGGGDIDDFIAMSSGHSARSPSRRQRVRSVLPKVYCDPGTTPLKCTVTRGDRDLVFEVTVEPPYPERPTRP